MIHITREGENPSVLAKIYGADAQAVMNANGGSSFITNQAVWIPCPPTYFPATDETMTNIASKLGLAEKTLLASNGHVALAKADCPVRLPAGQGRGLDVSAVYDVLSDPGCTDAITREAPFVTRAVLGVYEAGESLSDPDDEWILRRCGSACVPCGFLIPDPDLFTSDRILDALLHDLTFKEYSSAVITVSSPSGAEAAAMLGELLYDYGVGVTVCAQWALLDLFGGDEKIACWMLDEDSFEPAFGIFAEQMGRACAKFSAARAGYCLRPAAILADPLSGGRVPFDRRAIQPFLEKEGVSLEYDETRELACARTAGGARLEYEDLRSVYARLSLVRGLGADKIVCGGGSGLPRLGQDIATLLELRDACRKGGMQVK